MIKEIILKDTKSLTGESITINFDKKINVIIGPKGGGKSTLFDLVASLGKSKFPKKVKDALGEHGLEFIRAIKYNGEEINVNSLSTISGKEMTKDFEARNDVIFQDDPIKKELQSVKKIEKSKFNFIKDLIDNSWSIRGIINELKEIYNDFKALATYNNIEINWSNTFKMIGNNSSANELFLNLNYSSIDEIRKQDFKKEYLNKAIDANKEYHIKLNKLIANEINLDTISLGYKAKLDSEMNKQIKSLEGFNKLLLKGIDKIDKVKVVVSSFETAYKKVVDKIKQNDFSKSGLKLFEIASKDHFKNIAKMVLKLKSKFDLMINKEVVLKFDNQLATIDEGFMSFAIANEIKLSEDNIYSLMKVIFNTPKKAISDLSMWLEMVVKKGVKPFDEERLSSALSRILVKNVDIMANGMNYEHMSLGQKSIYGIEYKFKNSKSDSMFLDQPEDNLDNYTIAMDILRLIKEKSGQIFIVTHNANIGILSKPKKVIVANLDKENNQYIEGTIVTSKKKESDSAHFLEGGTQYIKERYEIINKGEK